MGGAQAGQTGPVAGWNGRTLKLGEAGTDVREWQEQMRRRGFLRLSASGVYDAQSAESCRWLQLYLRVPVTGQVDKTLWDATWTAP